MTTSECFYGDPTCPCRDGDPCHYEGENPMNVPPEYVRRARGRFRDADLDQTLLELEEYFERGATAEYGPNGIPNLNEEMRLLNKIQEAQTAIATQKPTPN